MKSAVTTTISRLPYRQTNSTTLRRPSPAVILHTAEGIPYAAPEVALLFKAKHLRDKDMSDFQRVLPALDRTRRARLAGWLSHVHPGHPWIATLATDH